MQPETNESPWQRVRRLVQGLQESLSAAQGSVGASAGVPEQAGTDTEIMRFMAQCGGVFPVLQRELCGLEEKSQARCARDAAGAQETDAKETSPQNQSDALEALQKLFGVKDPQAVVSRAKELRRSEAQALAVRNSLQDALFEMVCAKEGEEQFSLQMRRLAELRKMQLDVLAETGETQRKRIQELEEQVEEARKGRAAEAIESCTGAEAAAGAKNNNGKETFKLNAIIAGQKAALKEALRAKLELEREVRRLKRELEKE